MIVPTGWYSGARYSNLRRWVMGSMKPLSFVNLPYDVFHDAWVDTTVFTFHKRDARGAWPPSGETVRVLTFPKRHAIASVSEFENGWRTATVDDWFKGDADEFLTYADSATAALMTKVVQRGVPLSTYADVQLG